MMKLENLDLHTRKAIFFLLERSHTKKVLAGKVYDKETYPNIGRLSRDILKKNSTLFEEIDNPLKGDRRYREIRPLTTKILNAWIKQRGNLRRINFKNLYPKLKKVILENNEFIFNTESLKKLFCFYDDWFLPSTFGLIDTALFYSFFCSDFAKLERDNFRTLFKIFLTLKIQNRLKHKSFDEVYSKVSEQEESFFNLYKKMFFRKYEANPNVFRIFFNYISEIHPVVVIHSIERKSKRFVGLYSPLHYGIPIKQEVKKIQREINYSSNLRKSDIEINVPINDFLPALSTVMALKHIFD